MEKNLFKIQNFIYTPFQIKSHSFQLYKLVILIVFILSEIIILLIQIKLLQSFLSILFQFHSNLHFSSSYAQVNYQNPIKMILKRLKPIDQTSDYMEDLCKKNQTTVSSCGYITCALVEYFSQVEFFQGESDILKVNQYNLTPYIQKVMNTLKKTRKMEIKKFWNQMNESQRKNYTKDWVANFQVADYLENISQKMLNRQVFFFRQSAYDHEEALQNVKYEQRQRIKQELQFKGSKLFYTRYFPQRKNMKKEDFIEEMKKCDLAKPIILATDVLGHFNVTILFKGVVYVVDSLSTLATNFDQYIVEYIQTCYRRVIG